MRTNFTRKAFFIALGLTAAAFILPHNAKAEHFGIVLQVSGDGQQVQATMDTSPPPQGYNPRPVLQVQSGDMVVVHWRITNQFPHGAINHAGVHFYVAPEQSIGQKTVPSPNSPDTVLDNEFQMNFAPHASASGEARFRADSPGVYLVRLQSEGTAREFGHEHFAAVDLKVVP